LHPLDESTRRKIVACAAFCCAVSLCLAPLAGRTSFELARERRVLAARFRTPELDAPRRDQPVAVARDPFIAERDEDAPNREVPVAANENVVGMRVMQGQPIGFAVGYGVPQITAVITGTSPRALADDGAHVRVIAIGDSLAGSRVVSIDGAGVRLSNGTVLRLAEDRP